MGQSLKSVEIPPAAGIAWSPLTGSAITNYRFPALGYNPQFPHKCAEEVMSARQFGTRSGNSAFLVVTKHTVYLFLFLCNHYFYKAVNSWLYYTMGCSFSNIFWKHTRYPRESAITYSTWPYIIYEIPHLVRAHCLWVHIGGLTDRNIVHTWFIMDCTISLCWLFVLGILH